VIAWLKVAHIAAIAIWSATLLGLPSLLLAKSHRLSKSETRRLQHILRFGYVHLASPAAVVAIASGIALILLAEVFTPWMAVKLVFVGGLVVLHMRAGHHVVRLFRTDGIYHPWRAVFATGTTTGLVLLVLWCVLNKPWIAVESFPVWLRVPGSLQSLVDTMVPIP
jgi:putative membrane protein